jgi:hypothetical protein
MDDAQPETWGLNTFDDGDPVDLFSEHEDDQQDDPTPPVQAELQLITLIPPIQHAHQYPHQEYHGFGPVIQRFAAMIGRRPSLQALISLRELFACTGKITRDQKRSHAAMEAEFESQRVKIFTALEQPVVFLEVARILDSQTKRKKINASQARYAWLFTHFRPRH